MEINSAEFIMSNQDYRLCPKPTKPEYAFIGRSNVGKSSLINMLTNRKKLAKTSGTPGKTQLINHFEINEEWFLVDLPGYGYAKVSKKDRGKFKGINLNYLENRENLMCTFLLIDSRHPAQKVDMDFMEWLARKQVAFVIIFTKGDKLKPEELEENVTNYMKKMEEDWAFLPQHFTSSSVSKLGQEEILNFIEKINKEW